MITWLHIGSGKTGTTSIQHFLQRNYDRLLERGYLYPRTPGRIRHTKLALYATPPEHLESSPTWAATGCSDPASFHREFECAIEKELTRIRPANLVLSDEALFGLTRSGIERMHGLLSRWSEEVRVVVYLRHQAEHLVSRYQQTVKYGETRTLEDFLTPTRLGTYNYYAKLRRWAHLFREENISVRPFIPENLFGGELTLDFLKVIGIEALVNEFEGVSVRANVGLDAASVEFLRRFNERFPVRRGDPVDLERRDVVQLLVDASSGPPLRLSHDATAQVMRRYRRSNAKVAREFLGRPDGVMFPCRRPSTSSEGIGQPRCLDLEAVLARGFAVWGAKQRRVEQLRDELDLSARPGLLAALSRLVRWPRRAP